MTKRRRKAVRLGLMDGCGCDGVAWFPVVVNPPGRWSPLETSVSRSIREPAVGQLELDFSGQREVEPEPAGDSSRLPVPPPLPLPRLLSGGLGWADSQVWLEQAYWAYVEFSPERHRRSLGKMRAAWHRLGIRTASRLTSMRPSTFRKADLYGPGLHRYTLAFAAHYGLAVRPYDEPVE